MGFSWSPDHFPTDCDRCCATPELYRLSQDTPDGFMVAAYEDDTCVWLGDSDGPYTVQPFAKLNAHETSNSDAAGNAGGGDVLWTNNKRISAAGEDSAANIAFVPTYIAGDDLWFSWSRGNRPSISIMSLDATAVDIFFGGNLQTTLALTPGQYAAYTAPTGTLYGAWNLISDGDILAFKQAATFNNNDACPIFPDAEGEDMLGFQSNTGHIVTDPGVSTTAYQMETGVSTGNANGSGMRNVNHITFGTSTNNNGFNDPRAALRVVGARALNQRGDNDGGTDTPGSPIRLLRTHHLIPQPAEYVSVVTENAATVERFDPSGALVETITTAKTSGEPCLLYTSPSPRDLSTSRMPSSA